MSPFEKFNKEWMKRGPLSEADKRGEDSHSFKGGTSWKYAQYKWEEYWNEIVPEGYFLHHVDRNPKNNEISNLALVTRSFHAKVHKKHLNLPHIKKAIEQGRRRAI